MSLSIFNSNQIFKIVLIFVVIFSLYNALLIYTKPDIKMFQNPNQSNLAKSQEYIYNQNSENIIVGSSMSATIKNSFLPHDYFNLSFSGGSSLTGLEIIKRSGKIPKSIFIETNILLVRDIDYKILNQIYTPVIWKIKFFIPSLQEKYQPLNIVSSLIYRNYGKTHKQLLNSKRNEKVFNSSIERQLKILSKELTDYEVKVERLSILIHYFESLGTKVYFFQLPVEKLLQNSKIYKEQKNILKNYFDNIWISYDMKKNYLTSDGIHLTYKSAYIYSRDFFNAAKEIGE